MKLRLIGHDDRYAVEQLQLTLFPGKGTEVVTVPFSDDGAVSALYRGKIWLSAVTTIRFGGKTVRAVRRVRAAQETVRLRRRALQQSYYFAALQLLPQPPAWGALAGVRPTKLSTRCLQQGGSPADADRLLKEVYYVTAPRRALAVDCSMHTVRAAAQLLPTDVSVYVGIPFCPTRCTYCSFVSRTVGSRTQLLEPYLEALHQEIQETGKWMASSGRKARTIYIGGGTPTTLSEGQLAQLLDALRAAFDLSRCVEFTVEGGRPDTLDVQKLQTLRAHGADRISINPQTMENNVLRLCGRPHTGEEVLRAYAEAVDAGFSAINMDLIAGLPGDSLGGFRRSLDTLTALRPANITVHTLALKKGADLFARRQPLPDASAVEEMVNYANATLRAQGYQPYYLYRQKYMSGNFENVGWSRDHLDCLYNICMMEELHPIVSLGGGGMSKIPMPDGALRRFHNPKFPEQYIEMLQTVLAQKRELFAQMKGSV